MAIRQPHVPGIPQRPPWQSRYHGLRLNPDQFLALPEAKPYLEYVDGVVLQKPMANTEHSILAAALAFEMGIYVRQRGGWVGVEARAAFGELPNYRLPDVSYWSPDRSPTDDSLPTLAIEIRSPSQTLGELREKCRAFRRNGVDACWLIDPASRTAERFEGIRDAEFIVESGSLSSDRLPGFVLPLRQLFAVLPSAGG